MLHQIYICLKNKLFRLHVKIHIEYKCSNCGPRSQNSRTSESTKTKISKNKNKNTWVNFLFKLVEGN